MGGNGRGSGSGDKCHPRKAIGVFLLPAMPFPSVDQWFSTLAARWTLLGGFKKCRGPGSPTEVLLDLPWGRTQPFHSLKLSFCGDSNEWPGLRTPQLGGILPILSAFRDTTSEKYSLITSPSTTLYHNTPFAFYEALSPSNIVLKSLDSKAGACGFRSLSLPSIARRPLCLHFLFCKMGMITLTPKNSGKG